MSTTIMLGNKIDIFNLSETEAILQQHLQEDEMVINLSKLEHFDFSGVQLLISFIKTAKKNGHMICFEEPNKVFLHAIEVLGIQQDFNFMDHNHG